MLVTEAPADQVESGPADFHRAVTRNLVALVLGLLPACSVVLFTRLAQGRSLTLNEMIVGLIERPLPLLIWFGPVLWIGVAAFEEASRVFTITRVPEMWPGASGRWTAILGVTILGQPGPTPDAWRACGGMADVDMVRAQAAVVGRLLLAAHRDDWVDGQGHPRHFTVLTRRAVSRAEERRPCESNGRRHRAAAADGVLPPDVRRLVDGVEGVRSALRARGD